MTMTPSSAIAQLAPAQNGAELACVFPMSMLGSATHTYQEHTMKVTCAPQMFTFRLGLIRHSQHKTL